MSSLKRTLTLKDGIALGVGSVMGSGVLFLPSFTYDIAGSSVLISWVLSLALCLPLLVVFRDMVSAVPDENGLKGFVERALGGHAAAAIPILLLGTVSLGMPSAALIAGSYVQLAFGLHTSSEFLVAFVLLVLSVGINFFGVSLSSTVNQIVAYALFALGAGVFFVSLPNAAPQYVTRLSPDWNVSHIISGAVISFWAFAGFENMTFTAGEFKNPKRDIALSILIALGACGLLYVGLTANYAALANLDATHSTTGLFAIVDGVSQKNSLKVVVSLFAIGAVFINLTSWSWGLSRLVYSGGKNGELPRALGTLSTNGVPRRALLTLFSLFCISTGVAIFERDFFETGLKLVSVNFVFLYLIAALAYLKLMTTRPKRVLGLLLCCCLTVALLNMGSLVLYPCLLFAVPALISKIRKPHSI